MPLGRRRGVGLIGATVIGGTAYAAGASAAKKSAHEMEQQQQIAELQAQQAAPPQYAQPQYAPPQYAPPPPVQQAAPGGMTDAKIEQLQKLANLKQQGVLSEEEFAAQKAKLLAS